MIDKGKIAEQGTHDELLAMGGVYKKLVLRQLNAGQVAKDADADDNDESQGSSEEGSSQGDNGDSKDNAAPPVEVDNVATPDEDPTSVNDGSETNEEEDKLLINSASEERC